jgi:hypothetical protein
VPCSARKSAKGAGAKRRGRDSNPRWTERPTTVFETYVVSPPAGRGVIEVVVAALGEVDAALNPKLVAAAGLASARRRFRGGCRGLSQRGARNGAVPDRLCAAMPGLIVNSSIEL